ncbi:hypothetical protein [Romboutsia sp. 1001713B170207_170306_H8]|uniref:hypothetical protein n=1 Tax=Romboutsia sp. 1001713B170207_170306_H8 TaxID=2787112 RepID=UPI001898815C|nr:hypothetical protein [Romboutsia sp. 1001713B170207_170306_H8]
MENNKQIYINKLFSILMKITFDKDNKNRIVQNNLVIKNDTSLVHLNKMSNNSLESRIASVNTATRNVILNIAKSMEPMKQISNMINRTVEKIAKTMQATASYFSSYKTAQKMLGLYSKNVITNLQKLNTEKRYQDNIKKLLYKNAFIRYKDAVNMLHQNNIFPPINYIIEKDISYFEDGFNIKEFIISEEVVSFYLSRIRKWKEKHKNIDVIELIDEIEFNLQHRKAKTLSLTIPTLMEALLKSSSIDLTKKNTKSNGGLYPTIKKFLIEKLFEPLNIIFLHKKFINENLYNNTRNAKNFSRHTVHGEKLELANMETAMNMIFIYDLMQEIIITKKTQQKIA